MVFQEQLERPHSYALHMGVYHLDSGDVMALELLANLKCEEKKRSNHALVCVAHAHTRI